MRRPFLGLKFAICGLFLGLKFCSDFFGVRDFGKDFFAGLNWTFFGLRSGPLDFLGQGLA